MLPYKVLAEYHPIVCPPDKWNSKSGWRCWKIGEALTSITEELGLVPLNDPVHGPQPWANWVDKNLHAEVKWATPDSEGAEAWHYDGDTTPGSKTKNCLVLWTSKTPTLIKFKDKIYQPKPFELVIFKNLSCTHRRPDNAPKDRFIFRQRVEVPKHIDLP